MRENSIRSFELRPLLGYVSNPQRSPFFCAVLPFPFLSSFFSSLLMSHLLIWIGLKSPKKGPKIKIAKRKFSIAEEQYLHKGVERFGVGKWKEILMSYNFNNRTAVDLKDKWRNIQKNKKG
eukprot:Phypoly_transcript_13206.p1 GENE.Phypoly_transcript_13206~~Phypoly_transcript_13206.p1  ORF type:complete len:121 (-),score=12.94 Phypoly_transcript_13206:150-512(-)